MPFCATCGAPVEGRFCAKCGSTVGPAGAPMGSVPPGPGPQPIGTSAPMADNVASALCYGFFFFTGILFLVMAPYNQNKTVRFHAFQSIFFSVGAILIRIALGIVMGMMFFAGGGIMMTLAISGLISLAF